jgi:LytS/YehU family sensor histidine kinase
MTVHSFGPEIAKTQKYTFATIVKQTIKFNVVAITHTRHTLTHRHRHTHTHTQSMTQRHRDAQTLIHTSTDTDTYTDTNTYTQTPDHTPPGYEQHLIVC